MTEERDPAADAGQRNDPYVEPPRDKIPKISRAHVAAMEAGDNGQAWVAAGMHHLVLRTVGRRSGGEHKVALPYWLDAEEHRVVVASFSGAPRHPSWYLNLTDRTVNAEVLVRSQHGSYWSRPELLEGEEYDSVWAALTDDRPFYKGYQSRTDRRIPLVRLPETRPAGEG